MRGTVARRLRRIAWQWTEDSPHAVKGDRADFQRMLNALKRVHYRRRRR